ncbi:MAG: ACP S-malonyltransferase [Clostridia bacterium]|nr:ACP S-malonyltransferase [Clostridia bacterium]
MNKFALLFPGQGSQYVKMGKSLCDEFASAKKVFEEANEALGFDLMKLCFEGDLDELTKTENAQPAILTASVAAFKVYMEQIGILPVCAGGHSLGEYSALVCSGAVQFSDAVKIVRQRGKFMQEAVAQGVGAMAAIGGLEKDVIEAECRKISTEGNIVVVSNYNSPNQTVISGNKGAVDTAGQSLKDMGGTVTPLKVSAPFHSPLMQPAADRLKDELINYKFNEFKFPVISNVTALPYEGSYKIIENLTTQIVAPVQWVASMQYVEKLGINIAVEAGPQTVLRNLMKRNAPSVKAYSYDKSEDVEALLKVVKEQSADSSKANGPTVVTRCMAVAVCTRNRNWNNEEYQKGVSEPYKKIQQMQEEAEKSGVLPTVEQMKEALEMLRSVFVTKQTPVVEQIERFNQIFDETGTRYLFSDFKMPVKE